MNRTVSRKIALWAVLLALGAMVWGCAPAAPPAPTATPVPKVAPTPEVKPTPPPKAAWQQEWEQVVAAAVKEGKVSVAGPGGAEIRKVLVEDFQKAFPAISVDFVGASGGENTARILKERQAGLYLLDVYIGGPEPALSSLKAGGVFEPLEPALILPDVKDPKKWYKGKLDFIDAEGKYYLAFWLYVGGSAIYNPTLADPAEFQSWWDFTKPKWQGKIVMYDPTVAGAGEALVNFAYQHPDLGPALIKALLDPKHGVTLTRDHRQLGEWVGQGRYAIGLAPAWRAVAPLAKELPIKVMSVQGFKEGAYLTCGFGAVALVNRAPHPNAARVFINWLLTKEAQAAYSQAAETASARVDVPKDFVPEADRAKEGMKYLNEYYEEIGKKRPEAVKIAREVLGR